MIACCTAHTVLVVDDSPTMRFLLHQDLVDGGYIVLIASSGQQALEMVQDHKPDLVLLDLCLPDYEDGLAICQRIAHLPIIVHTTISDEWQKVRAFDLGVYDYIIRPVGKEELLARIRACLRRIQSDLLASNISTTNILQSRDGYLKMYLDRHIVIVGEHELSFSTIKFELLRLFLRYEGKILTPRFLLETIWGPGYGDALNTLRVHIHQLRLKIEKQPSQPFYIRSISGIGYMLYSESRAPLPTL